MHHKPCPRRSRESQTTERTGPQTPLQISANLDTAWERAFQIIDTNNPNDYFSFDEGTGTAGFQSIIRGNTASGSLGLGLVGAVSDSAGYVGVVIDARTPTDGAFGTADIFRINEAGTVVLNIDKSGNVGIGTAGPSTPLHVRKAGTSGVDAYTLLMLSTDSGNGANNTVGDASIIQMDTYNGGAYGVQLQSVATVGGGGYPNNDFKISIHSDTPSAAWYDRFTIKNNGNVGIGMTPVQKLDVAGSVHASDHIYVDNETGDGSRRGLSKEIANSDTAGAGPFSGTFNINAGEVGLVTITSQEHWGSFARTSLYLVSHVYWSNGAISLIVSQTAGTPGPGTHSLTGNGSGGSITCILTWTITKGGSSSQIDRYRVTYTRLI